MNQGKIYQIIHDYIINETNPNVELFKTYIDALKSNSNDIGLVTKYRAMTEAPSTIEKTMNDVQLFESGSPFWTTDLTIKQIQNVLKAREELIQQGYSDFMGYLLTTVREPNYDINYIGQEETALTCYYKLFNFL